MLSQFERCHRMCLIIVIAADFVWKMFEAQMNVN